MHYVKVAAPLWSDTPTAKSRLLRLWLPALLLAALGLSGYLLAGAAFDALGVFQQYNVLFDADPNTRLICFATGWGGEGRSLAHPNLCNLVNPPIRVLALALQTAGLAGPGVERQLALVVAPFFATASVVLLYATLLLLGCRTAFAFTLALLYEVSFSQLIFGSIPDHFILGGFSLGLTMWLLIYSIDKRRLDLIPWALTGALVASITITNFLLFLLALAAACAAVLQRSQALLKGLLVTALALTTLLAVKLPLDAWYGDKTDFDQAQVLAERYLRDAPLQRLPSFLPIAVASFAAPDSNRIPQRLNDEKARYDFQLTLEEGRYSSPLAIAAATAVAALLLAGLCCGYRCARQGGRREWALLVVVLGTFAFNAVLHAGWGSEYFLYSQHWLLAGCLLLAFIDRSAPAHSPLPLLACATTAGLVLTANLFAMASLLRHFQTTMS